MMSAENLVMSYKKSEPQRITGSKDISVFYWSDDSSSSDDYKPKLKAKQISKKKKDNKLDSNITKYIKKKPNGR